MASNKFLEYYAIFLTMCMTRSFILLCDEDILSFVIKLSVLLFFIYCLPFLKKDFTRTGFFYCAAITIGFFFHKINGLDVQFFGEVLVRVVPILIILHYKEEDCPNKWIKLVVITFFVCECAIAIYEKLTLTHLIDYDSDAQAMNEDMYFAEEFRSFSLMGHPLANANIVSIMLAFILCSNQINRIPKTILVLLGLGAIWAFNSRASMMMWIMILFYRIFLYGKSLKWILISVGILLIALPSIIIYVQETEVLGRLDFDFSDGSTMTRILAFEIFFSYPWSLKDMIMGGVILEQPTFGGIGVADYVYIENGYLLDLGYWGFILGTIKILGEIVISYQALKNFHIADKVIIMIAIWGVASMNNNTFYSWLMPFFMCSYLAFGITPKLNNDQDDNNLTKTE